MGQGSRERVGGHGGWGFAVPGLTREPGGLRGNERGPGLRWGVGEGGEFRGHFENSVANFVSFRALGMAPAKSANSFLVLSGSDVR